MSFATALTAIGTGISVLSQIQAGRQQQSIFEFNAAIGRQQAVIAQAQGQITKEQLQREKVRLRKRQVAAFGKSGVRASGSPFQVIADSMAEAEFAILVNDYNTRVNVLNALAGAELDVLRGEQARTASLIGAGTTLLTLASTFRGTGSPNIPTFQTPNITPSNISFGGGGIRTA